MAPRTTPPSPKASLLTLPRELRNIIYDLVLVNTEVYIEEIVAQPYDSAQLSTPTHNALLRTSRQLYDEVSTPYYRLTTFYIDDTELPISWYQRLDPSQRANIRDLCCVRPTARRLVWIPEMYGQDYGSCYPRVTRESPHVLLERVRGQFEQAGCTIRDGG